MDEPARTLQVGTGALQIPRSMFHLDILTAAAWCTRDSMDWSSPGSANPKVKIDVVADEFDVRLSVVVGWFGPSALQWPRKGADSQPRGLHGEMHARHSEADRWRLSR